MITITKKVQTTDMMVADVEFTEDSDVQSDPIPHGCGNSELQLTPAIQTVTAIQVNGSENPGFLIADITPEHVIVAKQNTNSGVARCACRVVVARPNPAMGGYPYLG